MKHIITISGFPGSGKSSTAKGVAHELGYEHFSSGDLFRKIAAERGLTIEEINRVAEKQQEIDHSVDELLIKIGREKNDLVIDSRMAFHWIPDSFKVFLDLDLQTAAERTFADIKNNGRLTQTADSFEDVLQNTKLRMESEMKRYQNLYNVDFTDKNNFDLVIDVKKNDLEEVIKIVVSEYGKWACPVEKDTIIA